VFRIQDLTCKITVTLVWYKGAGEYNHVLLIALTVQDSSTAMSAEGDLKQWYNPHGTVGYYSGSLRWGCFCQYRNPLSSSRTWDNNSWYWSTIHPSFMPCGINSYAWVAYHWLIAMFAVSHNLHHLFNPRNGAYKWPVSPYLGRTRTFILRVGRGKCLSQMIHLHLIHRLRRSFRDDNHSERRRNQRSQSRTASLPSRCSKLLHAKITWSRDNLPVCLSSGLNEHQLHAFKN